MNPHAAAPSEPQAPEPEEQLRGRVTIADYLASLTPHAWVTPTLVALIAAGFVVEVLLGASPLSPTAAELLAAGGDFGPSVAAGEWWRPFTSLFLHAGLIHIAFNLWAFWNIGKYCERIFGNLPFLALYLFSGFGGALASLAIHPLTVCIGASGAIFGVYGAMLAFVMHPENRAIFPRSFLVQQRNSLLGFVAYNVVFGLSIPNIDMSAHGGGLVTGMLAGVVLGRDLAHPKARVGRRILGAAAMVVLLGLAAVGVHKRLGAVPGIRADRLARAAYGDLMAGKIPEAIDLYSQALALEKDAGWHQNRGVAYLYSRDLDRALADFRAADLLEPTPKTGELVCETSARMTNTPGQMTAAVKWCTDALARDPKSAEVLAWRASAYDVLGKPELARADASAALALDPTSDHAVTILEMELNLRVLDGKLDDAEAWCAPLLKVTLKEGIGAVTYRTCARLALARGDTAAAQARLEKSLALEPSDPETQNDLAWTEVIAGDFGRARVDADKAVALAPEDAAAVGTRCFALVGLGEVALARADCAHAVALNPESLPDRGMLAFLDRRYADARRSWQAASADPELARNLAPWMARLPAR